MTVLITANDWIASEYSTFNSKVSDLVAACLFGNGDVSNSLRISALNGAGNLGEMTAVYSAGITLNDDGGITLTPAGTGTSAARLILPYTPVNNGETCVTLVSALSVPTFVQLVVYAGYRIAIASNGNVEAVDSADANTVATSILNLADKGYMSSTEALKSFVIVTELRTIEESGVRLTVSLHDSTGALLTSAVSGISGAVLNIAASTPYIGGSKAGATAYKSAKHYGHLIFHRQLTDVEKISAAEQLAGYANSMGAGIA